MVPTVSKKAILHIGSGKTGSTSIQASLSKLPDTVPISYPKLLTYTNNQIFRFAFCRLEDTPKNIKLKYENDPAGFIEFQKAIIDDFAQANTLNNKDVIISSEFLFLSSKNEVLAIKEFLSSLGFDEFHVIAYVRNPASYYLSVAQQALKTGPKLPQPSSFEYSIKNAIENWQNLEANSFTLREFSREKLIGNDVVKDFESFLGDMGISCTLPNAKKQNETMSAEATQIIQDAQRILKNNALDKQAMLNSWVEIRKFVASDRAKFGSKPKLKKEIEHIIGWRFRDEVNFLVDNYNILTKFEANECYQKHQYKEFYDVIDEFSVEAYLDLKGLKI